jgi:capsid assembly protease
MSVLTFLQGPMAITPETLSMMWDIYDAHLVRQGRLSFEDLSRIEASTGKKLDGRRLPTTVQNGVAVIPVMGPLIPRANMFQEISGATSYDMIRNDIAAALADPGVNSVLLNIDSPGGSVNQLYDLASFIREASTQKPMASWSDGSMTSAAQLIGAATGSSYIGSDAAQLGSIGVITMHRDISAAESQRGEKTTVISAGRYKDVGHPFGPLSAEHKGIMQDRLDYLYSGFVDAMAQYRNMDPKKIADEVADARIFTGRQAIDAGLADGMMSLDSCVAMMRDKGRGGSGGTGCSMATTATGATSAELNKEVTSMTRQELETNHASLFAEIQQESRQAGAAAALADERTRIAAVLAVPAAGHAALMNAALTDGSTAEQLSLRILQAEQGQREKHLEASDKHSKVVESAERPSEGAEETRAIISAAVSAGSVA